jgi:hypothetical protein
MTDEEWWEEQGRAVSEEQIRVAREEHLGECRRQRRITQAQLAEIVEEREQLEHDWAHKDEVFAGIMENYEEQLAWDERKLQAALEGGAKVEAGEYTLEDALPEERQLRLGFT